jgi:hypothetical protein
MNMSGSGRLSSFGTCRNNTCRLESLRFRAFNWGDAGRQLRDFGRTYADIQSGQNILD